LTQIDVVKCSQLYLSLFDGQHYLMLLNGTARWSSDSETLQQGLDIASGKMVEILRETVRIKMS
jgi:hypothetical protein